MIDRPSCKSCLHYNPFKEGTCKAYPNGIPKDIFSGRRSHLKVRKYQATKSVFKQRPDPFATKRDCVTLLEFSKSSCINCNHFNTEFNVCPAFPNGIPLSILKGEDLHMDRVKGQKANLFYTPKNSLKSCQTG